MNFLSLNPEVDLWIALRTAAHWEKKIAKTLAACEVPVFLPLMRTVTQYAKQKRTSDVPIFSGYAFCSEAHFLDNRRIPADCRKQVAQVLRPPDPAKLKQELRTISEFLLNHQLVQERLYGKPGEVVRIVSGPLTGTDGVIVALKPTKRRLVLSISFLNVQIEVEIDEHVVKKA